MTSGETRSTAASNDLRRKSTSQPVVPLRSIDTTRSTKLTRMTRKLKQIEGVATHHATLVTGTTLNGRSAMHLAVTRLSKSTASSQSAS